MLDQTLFQQVKSTYYQAVYTIGISKFGLYVQERQSDGEIIKRSIQFKLINQKALQFDEERLCKFFEHGSDRFIKLKQLYVYQVNLKRIPSINAPFLQAFGIRKSSIGDQNIDQFASKDYPLLNTICLQDVFLKNLPRFTAQKLSSISNKFTIFEGRTQNVQQFCAGSYPQLTSINFNWCQNNLVMYKLNAPKLQFISIQNNGIGSINQFFKSSYLQLKELNISCNNLIQLPSFENCPKIEKILAIRNNLESIDELSKVKYLYLKQLNCFQNRIVKIPRINAPNLVIAKFNDNQLVSIEQFAQTKHDSLEQFDLAQNTLFTILLKGGLKLKKLQLYNNKLEKIDSSIKGQFENLEYVNCQLNNLYKIPSILAYPKLSKLAHINLSSNKINSIEILSQINLQNVQKINLNKNYVCSLNIFNRLKIPHITEIMVSYNFVSSFDSLLRSQLFSQIKQNSDSLEKGSKKKYKREYEKNRYLKLFAKQNRMNHYKWHIDQNWKNKLKQSKQIGFFSTYYYTVPYQLSSLFGFNY